MTKKKRFYSGNYPNLPGYDENLPIGWNKWDAMEAEEDLDDEDLETENTNDNEPTNDNA